MKKNDLTIFFWIFVIHFTKTLSFSREKASFHSGISLQKGAIIVPYGFKGTFLSITYKPRGKDTKSLFLVCNLLTTELQKVFYLPLFYCKDWSQLHYLVDMNLFSCRAPLTLFSVAASWFLIGSKQQSSAMSQSPPKETTLDPQVLEQKRLPEHSSSESQSPSHSPQGFSTVQQESPPWHLFDCDQPTSTVCQPASTVSGANPGFRPATCGCCPKIGYKAKKNANRVIQTELFGHTPLFRRVHYTYRPF